MKVLLKTYLKKNIDENIKISEWKNNDKLPIYMNGKRQS